VTARVPGFDCASGWAESAHYRQHLVFLRVKLSLIVIFLEHQLRCRRSKTQRVLQQFEFERLWAHVCVCARACESRHVCVCVCVCVGVCVCVCVLVL
jgi:hypothetical protein